jgi:serine/threonine-protein kinase
MPPPSLHQRLKERKLVQWGLAYLAGGFVVLQILDAVAEPLSLSVLVQRAVLVLLGIGLLLTLVFAWYHGEQGRQKVSGPELLMVAALLIVAGGVLALLNRPESRMDSPLARGVEGRPGVAVLPCSNLSTDPDDAYLASALHDEILLKLQRISSLFSIGRTSVLQYADQPPSAQTIARALGVDFIAECSVQKYEGKIRLIIQLLEGDTGGQVWAESYDRDLTLKNLFDIQSEVAEQVASRMEAVLTPEEREQIGVQATQDLEAYEYYLRGNERLWAGDDETGNRVAIQMYNRAVSEDSTFALAYAQLATTHCRIWWYYQDRSDEPRALAQAAIERAVALASQHPQVLEALGYYHYWCWMEYGSAAIAFVQAIEGGSNPRAHSGLGYVRRREGGWERALEYLQRATALEPQSCDLATQVGQTLTILRRFREAEQEYDRGLGMCPADPDLLRWKLLNYVRWIRRTENARGVAEAAEGLGIVDSNLAFQSIRLEVLEREYERALAKLGELPWDVDENQQFYFIPKSIWYARVYDWLDRGELADVHYNAARTSLEPLIRETPDDSRLFSSLAVALAGLGQKEAALEAATRATEIMPTTRDDWRGSHRALDRAEVLSMVGEKDAAIDVLEQLLAVPSPISVGLLLIDPIWDPLRDHPRFQALLEEYADDVVH